MAKKTFRSLLAKARQRDAYWVGKAINDFTESLFVLMRQRDLTKADLARKIDKSPAYVTKVFRGNSNFTIDSMVRLVRALNGQLSIHVSPQENEMCWFAVPPRPALEVVTRSAGPTLIPILAPKEEYESLELEVEAEGAPSNERPLAA